MAYSGNSGVETPGVFSNARRLRCREVWVCLYKNIDQKHTWQMAAALAYYSVLSLFPVLVLLFAVIAFLPGHSLFDQAINTLTRLLPRDSMELVRTVVADTISPARGAYFSFGFLGTIWAASAGFSACIEALNIAYGVKEDRPFWKTRLLAVLLAMLSGTLLVSALAFMILGPRFGEWFSVTVGFAGSFAAAWPYVHWIASIAFAILGIEGLYLLGPTGKARYRVTLPGAFLAVGCWLGLSYLLGFYFRRFPSFDKTYGTLGAGIALLIWMYWAGLSVLLGAELNAELAEKDRSLSPEIKLLSQSKNLAA